MQPQNIGHFSSPAACTQSGDGQHPVARRDRGSRAARTRRVHCGLRSPSPSSFGLSPNPVFFRSRPTVPPHRSHASSFEYRETMGQAAGETGKARIQLRPPHHQSRQQKQQLCTSIAGLGCTLDAFLIHFGRPPADGYLQLKRASTSSPAWTAITAEVTMATTAGSGDVRTFDGSVLFSMLSASCVSQLVPFCSWLHSRHTFQEILKIHCLLTTLPVEEPR